MLSFNTQRGQVTDSVRIVCNKNRHAPRLARSIRSQPVINTGHYQRFKHPNVTRSLPIGIVKLSEVFMNVFLCSVQMDGSGVVPAHVMKASRAQLVNCAMLTCLALGVTKVSSF